ncbi:hypothetical protein [Micromonospora vulcania]|uniref:Uncharacterized protein n=1 Tax=Micromonospora vulcania TaxID=1441873 RepID=A0ABW1HAL0_9ACTN
MVRLPQADVPRAAAGHLARQTRRRLEPHGPATAPADMRQRKDAMRHPNRSRIVKAAAVTMALAALACEGEGGVKSDRPATDRVADPRAERVVTIEITEATGPYDVYVRAAKFGEALGDHTRDKIAGGKYKQTLDYTSGLKIEITITATGHRTDMFRCQISDGEKRAQERAAGQVQCKLTTSR